LVMETSRMLLVPYSIDQMKRAVSDPAGTAADAGYICERPKLTEYFARARIYRAKVRLMRIAPSAWLFCTYWQMVLKDTGRIIGELGFKGPPDGGEVEIGYGTNEAYRSQGYMTEAVGALCRYALTQNEFNVTSVVAATERKNYASHKVLERNGFIRTGMQRGLLMWKKTL